MFISGIQQCDLVVYTHTHTHTHTHVWLPSGTVLKNLPTRQETQVWSLGREDPLEKEMATCSRILAWEIPWTEQPGGLQPLGFWRLRPDWANTHTHTHIHSLSIYLSIYIYTHCNPYVCVCVCVYTHIHIYIYILFQILFHYRLL